MIDPYRMVFVSVTLGLFVLLSLVIYRLLFPKKKINYLVVLILISMLPLVSIFRMGSYESGDLSINAIKTMAYYNNLEEGILIPRWAGELNATLGYPLFIFTYPLPYFLASILHILGFGFIDSIKVLLISSFIFSGVFMYKYLKAELSEFSAFIGAIFYLFAPYHLINMHFRVAIGEMLAFMFIPLSLLFVSKSLTKRSSSSFFLTAVSIAGVLLSHQAVSLVFIPFLIAYCIFYCFIYKKNLYELFYTLASIASGILLSFFYIIPLLYYSQITHQTTNASIVFPNHLLLLFAPWRLGLLFQGPMGELAFPIGFAQIIILLLIFTYIVRKKLKKTQLQTGIFFLSTFCIFFLLMFSFSKIVWDTIPLLSNFQFSYRLSIMTSLSISVLAGLFATIADKKIVLLITFFAISLTILNWGNRRNIPEINDSYLFQNLPESSYLGEGLYPAMPYWTDRVNPFTKITPDHHLEFVKGNGKIEEISRKTTQHIYKVTSNSNSTIRENTLYFPGWKAYVNEKEVKIIEKNPITFQLHAGVNNVKLVYEETKIIKISLYISLLTLFLLIIFLSKDLSKTSLRFPKFYP